MKLIEQNLKISAVIFLAISECHLYAQQNAKSNQLGLLDVLSEVLKRDTHKLPAQNRRDANRVADAIKDKPAPTLKNGQIVEYLIDMSLEGKRVTGNLNFLGAMNPNSGIKVSGILNSKKIDYWFGYNEKYLHLASGNISGSEAEYLFLSLQTPFDEIKGNLSEKDNIELFALNHVINLNAPAQVKSIKSNMIAIHTAYKYDKKLQSDLRNDDLTFNIYDVEFLGKKATRMDSGSKKEGLSMSVIYRADLPLPIVLSHLDSTQMTSKIEMIR